MKNSVVIRGAGEDLILDYTSQANFQFELMKQGLGNPLENKANSVELVVPSGAPKSKMKELQVICNSFGFKLTEDSKESWESGGFGSKVDWFSDNDLSPFVKRGVDVSNADHIALVREIVKRFEEATADWKALMKAGIVKADASWHAHSLPAYKKKRS